MVGWVACAVERCELHDGSLEGHLAEALKNAGESGAPDPETFPRDRELDGGRNTFSGWNPSRAAGRGRWPGAGLATPVVGVDPVRLSGIAREGRQRFLRPTGRVALSRALETERHLPE